MSSMKCIRNYLYPEYKHKVFQEVINGKPIEEISFITGINIKSLKGILSRYAKKIGAYDTWRKLYETKNK